MSPIPRICHENVKAEQNQQKEGKQMKQQKHFDNSKSEFVIKKMEK